MQQATSCPAVRRLGRCAALVVAMVAAVACSSERAAPATVPGTAPSTVPISQGLPTEPSTSVVEPSVETTIEVAPTTSDTSVASTAPASTPPGGSELEQCLATWSLDDRIALLTWPSVYSDQWSTAQAVVRDNHVGGVVLMKPSNDFAADLAGQLAALEELSHAGLLVSTDEEGGAVQRLKALGVLDSQEALSQRDATAVAAIVRAHAAVIADAGIDVVLGPVVDVRPVDGEDPLGQSRLFLGDAERVAELAAVYVDAWQSAGMLPVLKHFPGHGSASTDTHQSLATTPDLDALRAWDLVPYARLAGSGAAVMVGHLDVPGLTNGEPASLNSAAVRLLREELGYADALVLSDALGMGAVGVPVPEAAVRSIAAGVDVVLFTGTSDAPAVINAIREAVQSGRITEAEINDSALRVEQQLVARGAQCQAGSA
jgi:beta-N-acetylhexosaminidase